MNSKYFSKILHRRPQVCDIKYGVSRCGKEGQTRSVWDCVVWLTVAHFCYKILFFVDLQKVCNIITSPIEAERNRSKNIGMWCNASKSVGERVLKFGIRGFFVSCGDLTSCVGSVNSNKLKHIKQIVWILFFTELCWMDSHMSVDFYKASAKCFICGTIFKFDWTYRCFSECGCWILVEACIICQERSPH